MWSEGPVTPRCNHTSPPHTVGPPLWYLSAVPSDDLIGSWIELALHLDLVFPLFRDLNLQHSKFGSPEIQRKKLPFFCQIRNTKVWVPEPC